MYDRGSSMRGRTSRVGLTVCSYLLGVMTCSLVFYIFLCNGHISFRKPRRQVQRIYHQNEHYNSKGLPYEGPGDNTDEGDDFDEFDHCRDLWRKYNKGPIHFEEDLVAPTRQMESDGITRRVFINIGGTFPWSVELFLNTYPDAEKFHIHSFIKDKSYGVMYKQFVNHTLHTKEASVKEISDNQDITCFGCGYATTEKIDKIDIARWIDTNTNKSDYVIVRMESEEEKDIIKRIIDLKVVKHIDKYYTTSSDTEFMKYLEKELVKRSRYISVQQWDTEKQTYSDFLTVNPKSIPFGGNFVDKCLDTNSTEKFALFLYSKQSSPNIFKVLNLVQQFSPKNMVQATMFLPFQFFNANWGNHTYKRLFKTFEVGMYYSPPTHPGNNSDAVEGIREPSLRNAAVAVQKVFQEHNTYMQNILYSKDADNKTLKTEMEQYNYIFLSEGIDIAHLTDHVLNDGTVTMDLTGWKEGQYLMINMDVKRSEYLVLYMLRRFAPWLLNIFQCSLSPPVRPQHDLVLPPGA